ncbi:hypothetical protein [Algibacter lectus]|uniref:Uncharacterized protein n=2 Tax=Algibacter lectus TaxID=221126 RepID=A0A090VCC0_9FLAO|nr:hypothetical protein [Algibacter lectus]MWW23549.1 hypothetical protein [Algibacter lectus]TDY63772.1 hypothetical protein DFQ06_0666 [Algibacter lectus]GAL61763.1 hypothetical protein JCM19300_1586 [Algibacter lectus]SFC30602.1 hypothetical protein SAMN04489722_102161 [Algibacter lectus]
MKNLTQKTLILITMLFVGCIYAQQEKGIIGNDNWLSYWTDFKPKTNDYGQPSQILTGNITEDTKLTKREIYLLVGNVFVTGNATLTIEPGTIIMGDSKSNGSLIISKGSTLIAEGLETDPIVFTSSKDIKKSGDWGGLFILGDAPINQVGGVSNVKYGFQQVSNQNALYGGENARSNSGVLKYVRIEYAGKRTKDNGYFSGITLAGVGSETVLENVMVTYCKGNSFNVIGGVVNLDKMVSYRSNGNDFDFNYGTQCNITNSLAIRSPYVSGSEESRSMSISSYNRKEEVDYSKKSTLVTAKNISIINLSNDLASAIEIGLVKEGIYVSKDASLNMSKSVISGFNPAVILDNEIELSTENLNKLKFSEMYFNNSNGNIFIKNKPNNEDLENWYGNSLFFNVYSKGSDSETFINSQDAKNLDFRLKIDEIIASN